MSESRRGRPRSQEAHQSILDATRALLVESGYADVTMDRVAERAGVGKQTVYRRWRSKAPLVAESVMDAYGDTRALEIPDTGDIATDLSSLVRLIAKFVVAPENAALLRALAAAAADNPGDGEALYRQLTEPQHDAVVRRLRQGVASRQVRDGVNIEAVADAIIGAYLYRLLSYTAPVGGTLDHVDGLIDALVTGIAAR
ncbi:TetR/AcrR family transcriptional regulator [Mycolicibacterium frederiksbergense]|uniref:TetR/AcrR family transcriptional regulator n=1 Tax=Mycolicibacterium frederiksbergense TaxID=117567 RepID=A0A6H0S9D8_9MYCO|nr:TetR/AcrR family transcriptional regulator [Mycolicibacterium frederiksbergense]QIV83211.1 TetR/AcrR family transcriptional regulator [Mycolicibacterium frederiksbergense]